MKHVKMLGLAAVAAMALMALVGASTASATALYSGGTKLAVGAKLSASLSGTATLTTTEGTTLDTCSGGGVTGEIKNAGGSAATVSGEVKTAGLTWTNCTEPTSTLAGGTLEVHYTSGINGTVTASGFEVTVNTTVFGSCVFTIASGTSLGTLTGSTTTNAVLDINTVATRKSGLCPASAKWAGSYKVTEPVPLHVTAS